VYPLLRGLSSSRDSIAVLMYHTLGDDYEAFDAWTVLRRRDFLEQVRSLRQTHEIVSLNDALSAGPAGVREKPRAVLTFDDGNASLHTYLLPIVEAERLPVTVYVATEHLETREPYWFDAIMVALQRPARPVIDLRSFALEVYRVDQPPGPDRWLAISRLLEALKTLGAESRAKAALEVLDQAGTANTRHDSADDHPLAPLTIAQLRDVAASPWVTLGSHTHGHELLDQVPLGDALRSIERSRELLRAWTGREVEHFAYPNGNHNASLADAVAGLGFRSAVTTHQALWGASHRIHAIPRLGIGRYDGVERLKLALLGV
jgi:peptidoglycan/xylan/chitin deacetylase (PgdA/CDA1 family)